MVVLNRKSAPPLNEHSIMTENASAQTLRALLDKGAGPHDAIAAPNRAPLSYDGLRRHLDDMGTALAGFGIGRNDAVAIVCANGPEMASSFLTVACAAPAAPLNPAYRADELEFYLSDLNVTAAIVEDGLATPVHDVAARLGIPVLTLRKRVDEAAGLFDLVPPAGWTGTGRVVVAGGVQPDDVALVLHTSGTTSRPKIVPLTQSNLCASARHIGTVLQLTDADRCLNVMPLFHIHGLIAAVLSSLGAGGSVWCSPGFNALKFFGWLEEAKPTWYTAVPTMHQAILSRAGRNRDIATAARLRFIRSSSAPLLPQVMAELERVFGAPVIESYGMTEATHQMASNPLPPRPRKPGSVGIAAGPEVAVRMASGEIRAFDAAGEVVIRGPNVTPGYANNPAANEDAFVGGWFRTGDQGVIDAEGYLRITGRLKEIINRGGEKISPLEVDEVIQDHPAVAQVLTFAVPHDKLGEDVAAVVVLREGATATEQELRQFAQQRLADFKVPRKILFLPEIPKGATGKLQRIGLAAKLGLAG
jgi:acyl-CoA synthetase (AMP-forming)/AMP-acid ligase II